jgi:hypothetical protein
VKLISARSRTAMITSVSRLTPAEGLLGLFAFDPWKHPAPHSTPDQDFHRTHFTPDREGRNPAGTHVIYKLAQRLADAAIGSVSRAFAHHSKGDFVDDIALLCDGKLEHRRRRGAGAWPLDDVAANDPVLRDRHGASAYSGGVSTFAAAKWKTRG